MEYMYVVYDAEVVEHGEIMSTFGPRRRRPRVWGWVSQAVL